jgi:hypothetical protein
VCTWASDCDGGGVNGQAIAAAGTGWSVRASRTLIEVVVLAAGWMLGGSVGAGTLIYALAIGPLVQLLLPWFEVPQEDMPRSPAALEPATPEDEATAAKAA